MINETHNKAIEMSKLNGNETNPSLVILERLPGEIPKVDNKPENTVQLCQIINDIKGRGDLKEDKKMKYSRMAFKCRKAIRDPRIE